MTTKYLFEHPKLDLHGTKHEDVDGIVEEFILYHQEEMPLEIIYGNSEAMRQLVIDCLQRIGLAFNSGYKNPYGRLLITGYIRADMKT